MGTEWLRQDESNDEGVAMALGERIREVRKERGWSQADLGKRIGTDSQYVSRYETGRITPSVDALIRLADVLEVSTDYLVRDGAPLRVSRYPPLGPVASTILCPDEQLLALLAGGSAPEATVLGATGPLTLLREWIVRAERGA